jgi:muramidase (phage lysozyme)
VKHAELRQALDNGNVRAFLRVIRAGEGTSDPDGYRRIFGGELVESMSDHPRKAVTRKLGGRPITSTAAGAYQFLARTWDECRAALQLPDFLPPSQDMAAVFLIRRRRALEHVIAGRLEEAIAACAREWASLPGSPYGQPVKTMAQCRAVYEGAGGLYAAAAPNVPPAVPTPASEPPGPDQRPIPMEEAMPLPAFVAAALPAIISSIPALGKLFGSGSEVAERNVKAAELVVGIVQEATGARNAQEAVEVMASDPAAVKAATEAIGARWLELTETGGGIEAARKADAAAVEAGGMLQSPSFWVGLPLLGLVYLLVLSLIGIVGTATWSDDVRAGLAGSIISAVIGGLVGYYYGQTTSRNRTPG